jgi:NTE family protein
MAEVIEISSRKAGERKEVRPSRRKSSEPKRLRGGAPRPSKTALVLGGGGFTGAVYEIGALRAFDLMAVNSTVNDFDIYVGTSAGSFVGSMVANGITPDEMMRVLDEQPDAPFDRVGLATLLRPNYRGYLETLAGLPLKSVEMVKTLLPRLREVSAMDVGVLLASCLPTGFYSTAGVGEYVAEVLASKADRTNDFRQLQRELYLVATDVDTSERVVFGTAGWDDVPISKAVECSTALPIVYRPVKLNGRQLIDGGIPSTTNVDIAVERGASLIVIVNPLVPYVNDFEKRIPTLFGSRTRRVADLGMPAIAQQAFKLIAHSRLHFMVEQWKERYPGVDIILVEPEADDELMFGTSAMDYSQRRAIARHGFNSVRAALAADYDFYREIAERHGIEISGERLADDDLAAATPVAAA